MCLFHRVKNRFQPQTRLWELQTGHVAPQNHEIVFSCSNQKPFNFLIWGIYFKIWTANDCEVTAIRQGLIDRAAINRTFRKNTYRKIGGFHCRHVAGQNKRKFVHIVCIKIEVNSLIVPVHQPGHHDFTCKPSIEIQALLSRNRRIKQTVHLLKRLFQNDSSVALLFFWIITINFSAMSKWQLWACLQFFENFLTLWRNSSYGHPPFSPPPPRNLHWPLVGGGGWGGMDIFWNCTLFYNAN